MKKVERSIIWVGEQFDRLLFVCKAVLSSDFNYLAPQVLLLDSTLRHVDTTGPRFNGYITFIGSLREWNSGKVVMDIGDEQDNHV